MRNGDITFPEIGINPLPFKPFYTAIQTSQQIVVVDYHSTIGAAVLLPFYNWGISYVTFLQLGHQLCYLSTIGALHKQFWIDKLLKAAVAESVTARQ